MIGIIDVGGGLRGVYGAGVFDRCLDDDVSFDCCIGVSAGSANVASFLGNQKGRNYRFYHDYSFRKEYMSLGNVFRCGSFLDLNYIYKILSDEAGEDPLDYRTISQYRGKVLVVATEAHTGKPRYFEISDFSQDDYRVLNASCAIPFVCKPCTVNETVYYDGGVSDPVPIKKAIDEGCDKIVLILTKPKNYRKNSSKEVMASRLIRHKYPMIAEALSKSGSNYNEAVKLALEMEQQGKCLIIAPDNCCGVDTLTKDKQKLDMLYRKGYEDAAQIKKFIMR